MNLFGFPVEITEDAPPNQVIFAPSELIAALRVSAAAQTMAKHGILSAQLANDLSRCVNEKVEKAARDRQIGVLTNIAA